MASYAAPSDWQEWTEWMSAGLHGRSRWRLAPLMLGLLFAGGRRVVTSWLRAGDMYLDYRNYYYFLQSVGQRWQEVGRRVLLIVLRRLLKNQQRVLLAIDDTPTKRYGPKVQGAGIHHDPTPGPSGHPFCYGHIWVTLAVVLRHPLWGTIALPIWSWLYIRRCDVPKVPQQHGWKFRTKLELAFELVLEAVEMLHWAAKQVWVVVDGAYAKRPFVRPILELGVTLVGRLRKDAALRDLPPRKKEKGRGRKRKYGRNRISLASRAAHNSGWQTVSCLLYGKEVIKQVKTFLATHATFGQAIRVVIVRETNGPQFFYCTDVTASVVQILEVFADRGAIEQVFHDIKEIWGSGQQQVRNLWANIAVWHLNLWAYTLTEVWGWNRPASQLTRREDSPWDTTDRRPSHADRRKALQASCLENEFSRGLGPNVLKRKIRTLLQRLLRLAI